jgi:G3E family GTPase
MERPVPIYILSGFLGSGKTTLLSQAIRYMKEQDRRAAVVMNELGEVNLDGVAVGMEVPMAEMLDGCICCTVRGDLGITIQQLILDEKPDVVFIEATGVANPMEILDGVTEASLYMKVELKGVIAVVDAAHLQEQMEKGAGKTYRLMEEQIRCASVLILNKTDLVDPSKLDTLEDALKEWNPHAPLIRAVRAEVEPELLWESELSPAQARKHAEEESDSCGCAHAHDHDHGHSCKHHHHSHEHVMVLTRYLKGAVDSSAFEELVGRLPDSVYRAKGVLTFQDTANRYLFQYAYRQADFMKITPQVNVPDVVVFIGEQIPKQELEAELDRLEQQAAEASSAARGE